MSEKNYLWFVVNTIPNYEQKIARDLMAIKHNDNIDEIQEIIVPMVDYETPKGLKKEKPKFPNYFYAKLEVDANNQPPIWLWHRIRNTSGCIGILQRNNYMIGMDDFELKESLDITDEDIKQMSARILNEALNSNKDK